MRHWHRWAAFPAGLILFFTALTGVLLHLDMIRSGHFPPGHEPARKVVVQPVPSDAELARMVVLLADGMRAKPGFKATTLQINLSGPQITLVAGTDGPPGSPQLLFDARTGALLHRQAPPPDYHYVLQDLHAGYAFGWSGRVLSVLCGLALLTLAATGLQMWWGLRRRRKRANAASPMQGT